MQTAFAKFLIAFGLLDIFFFVQILAPSLELNCRLNGDDERDQSAFVKLITSGQMDVAPAANDYPAPPVFYLLPSSTPQLVLATRDFHFTPGRDPPLALA